MNTSKLKNVHFIGIGGAGVSGLARIALEAGAKVTGSDLSPGPFSRSLEALGVQVSYTHRRDNVPKDCKLVVASAAIRPDNPEHREARRRGVRILKYAEALGEFTRKRTNLCVAGTHGKTTASAMLSKVLKDCGKRPGFLVGGEPMAGSPNASWGKGTQFVIESCEYDRSFLKLSPSLILLNNIEADHLDVYGDVKGLAQGFEQFAALLPRHGTLIYNADDPHCREIAARAGCSTEGFGHSHDARWQLHDLELVEGCPRARVTCRGMNVGELSLSVPGRVNAMNALGVLAAANWAGVSTAKALAALRGYCGVRRRFELLGRIAGIPIVDDYAHHPTAVAQLLETAEKTWQGRRIVAVFQAHQYQRINGFFDGFADALASAGRVLVARTYAARESGIVPGEPEERLARELRSRGTEAMAYADFSSIIADISLKSRPDDAVLFIGAGDINEAAKRLLADPSLMLSSLSAPVIAGEVQQ